MIIPKNELKNNIGLMASILGGKFLFICDGEVRNHARWRTKGEARARDG